MTIYIISTTHLFSICDALHDLVPFAQFKKRENTHGGALLFKSNTPLRAFSRFLNSTNGHIAQSISYNLVKVKCNAKVDLLCIRNLSRTCK